MRKPFFRQQTGTWHVWIGGRQVNLKTADQAEAEERWHELMAVAAPDAPNAPFVVLANAFLKQAKRAYAESTASNYARYVVSFATERGNTPAMDLRPWMVTEWMDANGWLDPSRYHAIRAVKRCLNWAVDEGVLDSNPLQRLKLPPQNRRETLIPDETLTRILRDAYPALRLMLKAWMETGARPGEVAKLTAANVNLEAGCWRYTIHKTGKKTGKPRVIYLTPVMLRLSRWLVRRRPTGPLFLNQRGKPWTRNAWRCAFMRLRGKSDLPPGAVAYSIRHAYITSALIRGVPAAVVAELVGNSVRTIEKHYSHLSKKADELRAAARQARGA